MGAQDPLEGISSHTQTCLHPRTRIHTRERPAHAAASLSLSFAHARWRKQGTGLADRGPKFTSNICNMVYGRVTQRCARAACSARRRWRHARRRRCRTAWRRRATSTLTDTRPPCFEVEKDALRLGASVHYLPTNLGPSPLRTGSP
jgi:hypothetical protein